MQSPITSIMRKATKKEGEPYNIITFPTHERYQSGLTKTNANFYMWWSPGIKTWNDNYGPLPENHVLLDPSKGENQIPLDVQFDAVLSQNKFGQFQVAENISKRLHLPLISLEHTLPMQRWTSLHMEELRKLEGHINLFISEYSRNAWGWKPEEADVVHHGVDTDLFEDQNLERKPVVLSVVNDWINRDWCCNFQGWKRITQGLPVRAVGDTPGFSLPASSIENLVEEYNTARIFINTAHVSPIPTSLLEAMSCIPEGEFIFFNYKASKIEDIINLQTFNEKTRDDDIHKKFIVDYNDEMFSIKATHIPLFRVTKHHPIATVNITQKYDKTLKLQQIISDVKWKNAEDLNIGDFLVIPKLKVEKKTGLSKEWLRFYGLFLAEGNTSHGNIQITLHSEEKTLIQEIVDFGTKLNRSVNVRPLKNEKAVQIIFTHSELAQQLRNMFGHLAHNKFIPDELMTSTKEETEIFLDAYLDGDGNRRDANSVQVSTSSPVLSRQIFLLATKLNILPTMSFMSPKKGCIRGREFYGKARDLISWVKKHEKSKKEYLEDNDNFYVKVKKITKIHYVGKVYNLQTSSGTFSNPFALTHNCGCACVSVATCMIPEIITSGVNGFISNDENELKYFLQRLLKDENLAKKLGEEARKTIKEKFGLGKFVENWNNIFKKLDDIIFIG